ncbi:MAG: hypothetical protein ACR2LA_08715 [Acidimicrobiales bacterium]
MADHGHRSDATPQESATEADQSVPSIDVHQPGDSGEATLAPREVDGVPPDAVGAHDDQGAGPEERAPKAPDGD